MGLAQARPNNWYNLVDIGTYMYILDIGIIEWVADIDGDSGVQLQSCTFMTLYQDVTGHILAGNGVQS